MTIFSIGQGLKNPNLELIDADLPDFLNTLHPASDRLWSPHGFHKDYRKIDNWYFAQSLAIDIDYQGALNLKKRHSEPSADIRAQLTELPCPWHHTPRGARAIVELIEVCFDKEPYKQATLGLARFIRESLQAQGILAKLDKRGKPFDGYAPDTATFDFARFLWAPNAIVNGEARQGIIVPGIEITGPIAIQDLIKLAPIGAKVPIALQNNTDDIAAKLAKRPFEGEGDGSQACLHCASYAISLGVDTPELFIHLAQLWNRQRDRPWTDEELVKRFEDASAYRANGGMAAVPSGDYRRASLDRIIEEDVHYSGHLAFDEIEDTILYKSKPLLEEHTTDIEVEICKRYSYKEIPRSALYNSLHAHAKKTLRNRVQDYLKGLSWDGTSRMGGLVEAYSVIPRQRQMAEIYLRKWMMASVNRALNPGCKHDHMLIFVGPERTRKSTSFRILAGNENFMDTALDLYSKDAMIQIKRAWLVEWGEFESVTRKTDVARVKNFLSQCSDDYRDLYAKNAQPHPRRCSFVATSNSMNLIQDAQANRRFWVIENGARIDIEWLEANRDQLWAEARTYLEAGDTTYLDDEEEDERADQNAAYVVDDPLCDKIRELIAAGLPDEITSKDLYAKLLIDGNRVSPKDRDMITAEMSLAGYTRINTRIDGVRIRKYVHERRRLQLVKDDG